MTVNETLLRDTLTQCETEDWQQTSWRCGTARCFHGWAVHLAGATFEYAESDCGFIRVNGLTEVRSSVVRTPDGTLAHVQDYAAAVLGLDVGDAERIAAPTNTLAELRRMVSNLIDYGTVDDPAPQGYDIGPDVDLAYNLFQDAGFGL